LHVNQQILKTFCLLQVTDFFDTFLLELELEPEPEPVPEQPKLKSLEPEPEPPKWAAPTTLPNTIYDRFRAQITYNKIGKQHYDGFINDEGGTT